MLFYKIGIDKKLFVNSTFLGTTTGFSFPFVAMNYSFRNAVIIYLFILALYFMLINSSKFAPFILGNTIAFAFVSRAFSPQKAAEIRPIILTDMTDTPSHMDQRTDLENDSCSEPELIVEVESGYEEECVIGEFFDPMYADFADQKGNDVFTSSQESVIKDETFYYQEGIWQEKYGNYPSALMNYMEALKQSSDVNMSFESCMRISKIYLQMKQQKQAENILYCFIHQNKAKLTTVQMKQVEMILQS
ncbi:MAG: hypothetical protein ACOYVK_17790 [Bacillota bacterium]